MLIPLLVIAGIVVAAGVLTMSLQLRQGRLPERDTTMSRTEIKHPVRSNPGLIMYILFPILAIAGGLIWMYYF